MSDEQRSSGELAHSARVAAVSRSDPDGQGQSVHVQAELHVGPLNHPDVLRAYHEISPDLLDRVVLMAEKQGDHRRSMEAIVVRGQVANARLGMWLGLVVALVGLGVTAYLGHLGHAVAATIVACVDLVALVGIFVRGKKEEAEQEAKKVSAGKSAAPPAKD